MGKNLCFDSLLRAGSDERISDDFMEDWGIETNQNMHDTFSSRSTFSLPSLLHPSQHFPFTPSAPATALSLLLGACEKRSQAGETGADDAEADFYHGPDGGVDVGP